MRDEKMVMVNCFCIAFALFYSINCLLIDLIWILNGTQTLFLWKFVPSLLKLKKNIFSLIWNLQIFVFGIYYIRFWASKCETLRRRVLSKPFFPSSNAQKEKKIAKQSNFCWSIVFAFTLIGIECEQNVASKLTIEWTKWKKESNTTQQTKKLSTFKLARNRKCIARNSIQQQQKNKTKKARARTQNSIENLKLSGTRCSKFCLSVE